MVSERFVGGSTLTDAGRAALPVRASLLNISATRVVG
jgi:hypothetical protein